MRRYRAALIGAGRIGLLLEHDPKRLKPATHFGMWTDHPRTDLVAVCDSDPQRVAAARELEPAIATYGDASELLAAQRPDVVSIATWKDSHYELCKLALAHGVKVIVLEKPIAERDDHAREIIDLAGRLGAHLIVNHRRRFDRLTYSLRDELRDGLVGPLQQISSYYVYGLVTTGTHLVDTLRFLFGEGEGEIVWTAAFPNERPHFAPPDDPCVDGFLGFESGVKASVQSLDIKRYDLFQIDAYGESGLVSLHSIGREVAVTRVVDSPEHDGFTELDPTPAEVRGGAPRDQFRMLADNAVACLDGTGTSLSSGEDSLKALEILLAMQRSAADGGRVVRLD